MTGKADDEFQRASRELSGLQAGVISLSNNQISLAWLCVGQAYPVSRKY
jgi:hypothetical protein